MRRVGEVAVVLCLLAFVVTLYGCGGSGGPNGPSEGSAGKPPSGGGGEYYVTELPAAGGAASAAVHALSNPGTDEGESVLWAGGSLHTLAGGIVWRVVLPSKPSDEPEVTAFEIGAASAVYDINEYGRAVGATDHMNDPFYWEKGALVTLDDNGYEHGCASAIGRDPNTVRIGGNADMVEGEGCAVLWEFPAGTSPDSLAPTRRIGAYEGAFSAAVEAIQDTDGLQMAVYHWWPGAPEEPVHPVAVEWDESDAGQLVPTQAGIFVPYDMNAGGAVVGEAYLLQGGVVSVLPFLSRRYDQAQTWALNDQGVIVGQNWIFVRGSSSMTGVRWQGGKVADLNKLVDPGAVAGSIIDGQDINDLGQTVANSRDRNGNLHAYLLRPK